MGWKLSDEDDKLEKYSPAEQKLFQLLRKASNPINSTDLMELFYDGRRQPVHGRTTMNVSLKRLMQKVDQNKEPFKIVRSKRQGGEPIAWQIRTRTRRR